MNKRIKIISTYIDKKDIVADIGCDQALLSETLAKNSAYSIASDIKENIVLSAKQRIKNLKLDNYVKFIVSDGLENIDDNVDTLVLAGMGTYTILKILSKSKKQYKKIITISNNNHNILRVKMLEFGYKVDKEEIIFEKNKFYNLIVFKIGNSKYSEEEILFGKNHQNIELFNKKMNHDLKKMRKIYESSKSKESLNKIKSIEKMLKYH